MESGEDANGSDRPIREILDRMADGLLALDRNWTYQVVNAAAAGLLGRSSSDLIGKPIFEIVPEVQQTPFWDALQRATSQQILVEDEEYYPALGKWINVRIFPSAEGVTVYLRDVTEPKRIEKLLSENEAQFRTLADSIAQLAWIADATGYIFWYNQRWYEYTGKTPREMEGWGWQSVHRPEVLPQVLEAWQRSISTGEPLEMTFPLRGADGVFRPFLTRAIPMRDAEGKVLRWFGTNTDITAQRESEEALRANRERLQASLTAAGTGTFRWDIRTNGLNWDENLDRLFGLNPGETVQNLANFLERVHPEDRPGVLERCDRSAREGADFEMEFRVLWPDGSIHWLYDRGKTFCAETGQALYMTGACVDITERKHSEQSLQERARVAALGADVGVALTAGNSLREMLTLCTEAIVRHLEAAFARIWILDPTGTMLELQASSGLYTHTNGGHARVPVGKFKIGLIAQERQPHLTNDVLRDPRVGDREWARREGMVAFAGYPLIVENRLVGVIALFARHRLAPEVLQALGSVSNSIAVGIERKQSYAAMRESEARKTAILNTAVDGFITIDQDSRILEFNPAAEAIFGYSSSEVIGKQMPELLIPEKYRDMHYRGMAQYLNDGIGPILGKRIELEAQRSDGSTFPVELTVNRIPSDGPLLFTATIRDITDRKRASDELRSARDAAETASRAKSDFLASMSHELRTPLNAIIGYSEMLLEEAEEAGQQKLVQDLNKIHTAGRHLLSLISDILDLSKIEAGRMDVFAETFELEAAAREVATAVEPLIQKNGNRFTVDVAEHLGRMHSDVTKVRQILFNLLSNAAKFTNGGDINLSIRPQGRDGREMIQFSVSDTGIGIAGEKIDKLFEPFAQLAESSAQKQGGTGLGLAITKRFCEMLGGTIEVQSEAGAGSKFTILLPRRVQEPGTEQPHYGASSSVDRAGNRATVLVIDDDPAARELMQRYLEKEHVNTIAAASGEEGLRLARQIKPDLITLDVLMPGIDGWAVLQTLKADPELSDIPIIIATVITDRGLAFGLGATDYLTKPVTREKLHEMLRRHCFPEENCLVLLVEDDPESRTMLTAQLEKQGCRIEAAENGRQALAILAERIPHLILLDLLMPEMDGFEFAAELRRNAAWHEIPVIVITAKDLSKEDRDKLNGHIERVLRKGAYSREDLLREVRSYINRSQRTAGTQPGTRI